MTHSRHGATTHLEELARAAADSPGLPLLVLHDVTYSCRDVYGATRAVSHGLMTVGIGEGDRVVILLPNSAEAVWAWLGANAAGAIDAPISADVKGAMLDYYLRDLEPRLVITTQDLVDRMAAASPYRPEVLVLVGDDDGRRPLGEDVRTLSWGDLLTSGADAPDHLAPSADATATIIYTSGTTGPSKGVMLSHGYWAEMSRNHQREVPFAPGSVVYCVQPLCHIDPRSVLLDCLLSRSTFVLAERFSASGYWDDVERYDADYFVYIGTILHLVHKQPDTQSGRALRPRIGIGSATPASIYHDFQHRFNAQLVEGYGMTEVPFMTSQILGHASPGTIGRIVESIEGRLVDDDDAEVPDGEVGELIIRPRRPHVMMQGYWRKPEATLEALRNLWFHTGDLHRRLPDGNLRYIGRKKDSIRRRGENVSAWEVEQAAMRHPSVKEAAAIGVPSPLGDEDVAVLVVASDAVVDLDLSALRDFMAADLPRFAVPRFLEIVQELPKTPSERIAKGKVRERGITSAAHDAESGAGTGNNTDETR
jgi:crotonobetaine/carnitine-CoA ligase